MRRLLLWVLFIIGVWGGAFILIYGMHLMTKRIENGRTEDFKTEIKSAQLLAGIECPDSIVEQLAQKASAEKKLRPEMVKEASLLWRHVRLLAENLKKGDLKLVAGTVMKKDCRRFIEIADCGLPLEIWGEHCQQKILLVRKFL